MHRPLAAAILTALLVSAPAAANASESTGSSELQQRIDETLRLNPGGTQVSANQIQWDGGSMELTLVSDNARSIGSCATGSFCVYSGTSLTGSKLAFTSCDTTVSTNALGGAVRSLANARSSGYITGKNSAGGVLTQLNAGATNASAVSGITQVKCVS